jgi:hypothetical protein
MTAILPQSLFADIGDGLHIHYHAIGHRERADRRECHDGALRVP